MKPILNVNVPTRVLEEAEAADLIKADGYPFVFTIDVAAETNEPHWHDFGTKIMLLSGAMTLFDDERSLTYDCTAGTFVETNGHNLHHETHDGYRAVIGFDCDPSTMTRPVKKSPADRPAIS